MDNKIGSIQFKPIIFTPGLNQIYFVDYNLLNYISLTKEIIKIVNNRISSFKLEDIIFQLQKDFDGNIIKNYEEYKKCLFLMIKMNFSFLLDILTNLTNNISYLHKNQYNFLKSIRGNIYNKNPFHLLIDELFLAKLQKENNITFNFYTLKELFSTEMIENIIKSNKLFLFSYEHSILLLFKTKFKKNIFTFLLNTYLFCFKDIIPDSEEYKLVNGVKLYFENEKLKNNLYNNSPYILNSNVNFLSTNIFSYYFLYYTIESENIESYESLINYFDKIKPKIVLTFTRFLTRKQNFVKQRYFISDEKIVYKPHYGGTDKTLNGKVDIVLAKSYELKDFEEYKTIFNFLEENYNMANDIHQFKYFIDKNLQNKFLNNFCLLINKSSLLKNSKKEYQLLTIKSITLNLAEFILKEDIIKILYQNNIKFPIILKYTSDNPYFKHQVSIILDEIYLDNFINKYLIKVIDKKYSTSVLVQPIINHGGYVLKIYHMGNKNFIDYRSSLIDININNDDLLNDIFNNEGFWNFKTIMLESSEYKNNIWNKYTKKDEIDNKIKNNYDLSQYIINVANLFEIYSHMGLFGIDIIIENDKLYIIDANSLPGYKLGFNLEKDLRNYFNEIIL